jgi:hypothetical protein
MLNLVLALLLLALTACASGDESAVRQVVTEAERAAEEALNGTGDAAAVEQYFATPEEGANPLGMENTRDAFRKVLQEQKSGSLYIQLRNFQITSVQIEEGLGQARVTYQVDVTLTRNNQVGTATVTQDLALRKTPTRGWRLNGGDKPQLSFRKTLDKVEAIFRSTVTRVARIETGCWRRCDIAASRGYRFLRPLSESGSERCATCSLIRTASGSAGSACGAVTGRAIAGSRPRISSR